MNGIYWDKDIPRLFMPDDLKQEDFRIRTIADISDDKQGSVPCNLGDATIADPVYGVNRMTCEKTAPSRDGRLDVMAVGTLPNELPRDASNYVGEQLIKYVLEDIRKGGSKTIDGAMILKDGKLTAPFEYLSNYAMH